VAGKELSDQTWFTAEDCEIHGKAIRTLTVT